MEHTLTTQQAAAIIGVTPQKVAEYCSNPGGLFCKRGKGRRWLVREGEARDLRYKLTDGETRPIPGQLQP